MIPYILLANVVVSGSRMRYKPRYPLTQRTCEDLQHVQHYLGSNSFFSISALYLALLAS
jgi:hypothetical protein